MSRIRVALSSHRRSLRGARTERAATLVEYAMIVAVFVVPAWAGISFLQSTAEAKMGHVATNVAAPPTTSPAGSGGDGGGATTTTASTTTTTAAPTTTTTVKPTTTTTSTTTTTTSTTTTTTQPVKAGASAPVLTTSKSGNGNNKRWQVDGSVTITNASGQAINGAKVTFKIEELDSNGNVTGTTTTSPVTTANGGKATLSVTGLTANDRKVRVTVVSVTGLPAGTTWNGTNSSTEIARPSPW